jgi:hypothetical protein
MAAARVERRLAAKAKVRRAIRLRVDAPPTFQTFPTKLD